MSKPKLTLRTLAGCGLLMALSVVLARLLSFAPTQTTRYSLETLPIFLSGLLYGPLAGALVGFGSDALGCFLSPYGYNPLLSLPPLLLGLWAGLRSRAVAQKPTVWQLALALLPPFALGYIGLQSASLAWLYHKEAFAPFFSANLAARGIQYGLIFAADLILTRLLLPALRRLDI